MFLYKFQIYCCSRFWKSYCYTLKKAASGFTSFEGFDLGVNGFVTLITNWPIIIVV